MIKEDKPDTKKALLSVVLGSYNRKNFLKLTIEGIRDELKKFSFKTEIIVIDGGSTDGTVKWLTQQKDIISIIQHNRGEWLGKTIERRSWGYFMNIAFKAAQGKYICMLSDDCLVVPDAIINGYNLFEDKLMMGENVGGLAFYFRDWPDEKAYHVNYTIDNTMMINHGLFLRKALEEVNFIDEDNYLFYHADDDLALKFKQKGYLIVDSPCSFVEHFLHANIELRGKVYENERNDYANLINNWEEVFLIENINNIHNKSFMDYNYKHSGLSLFYKMYKRDVIEKKIKCKILMFKRFLKKVIKETYYLIKYFLTLLFLLFTNPPKLIKKIKNSYLKYF